MQIWCTSLKQSIYCYFVTANARVQQDLSCKVAQQLSARASLGAAWWLVVQQQQQQQRHQYHLAHMHTHKMTNLIQILKNNFQFWFLNVATFCSWQRSISIAYGLVSLTQIVCPLHQLCLGLATDLAKGTIYLSLKLRKLCFQSPYLQINILALLSTAIGSMTVFRNVATFATLIAHVSVCQRCTTSLSLPKHHWGITANTSNLRCINWRFFKLGNKWLV